MPAEPRYSGDQTVVLDRAEYEQALAIIRKLCQDDRNLRHDGLFKAQALLTRAERTPPPPAQPVADGDYMRMPWPLDEPAMRHEEDDQSAGT